MELSGEVHFDGWTLNRAAGDLVKGDRRVRLPSQPLMILEELLARPGELVTREQLIARLWPRGLVDFDTALNSAVRRLRTALADNADTPRYIETIPRRGYRFIGRLDAPPCAPSVMPESPPRETAVPTLAGTRGGRRAAAWLLLGVLCIIAFIFLRTGDPQSERAPALATSAEAQERFQRAEYFFQRRAAGDIDLARKYYAATIDVDPGFARAWAGLAATYWIDTVEGRLPPEQGLAKLRDAAERALALDPHLAEAHLRLANYRRTIGDLREYDSHMRKALELEPDNPLVLSFSANDAAYRGEFDAAVALQRRAVEADPLSVLRRYNLAAFLYQANRLSEAKVELLELRELSPTPDKFSDLFGQLLILEGRYDEALELEGEWSDQMIGQQILALAYHGLGRRPEADAALRRLMDSSQADDQLLVAEAYAWRGEIDAAFEWLQAASASNVDAAPWLHPSGRSLRMMLHSPFLRALHDDPRWGTWVESTGQLRAWRPRPETQ